MYLTYVFGEDEHLSFNSLDNNAYVVVFVYLSYDERLISVPSNKGRSRKTLLLIPFTTFELGHPVFDSGIRWCVFP